MNRPWKLGGLYSHPLLTMPTVSMPRESSMYKMRNVHAEESSSVSQQQLRGLGNTDKMPGEANSGKFLGEKLLNCLERTEPSPEYHELEARQTKILCQLADLKEQVSTLCYFLKHSNEATKLNKNEIPAVSSTQKCATDVSSTQKCATDVSSTQKCATDVSSTQKCATDVSSTQKCATDVSSTQKCVEEQRDFSNCEKETCMLSYFIRDLKSSKNDEVEVAADHVPSTQKPVSTDMIIHVDPFHPPYSLHALKKVWKDIDIRVTSYKQSGTNRSVQLFCEKTINPAAKTIVYLSLIWKNIKELETITGINRYNILGEVNFLRYISRLIDTHNYEKIHAQPYLLDTVLDWCYKTREHLETKGCTYDGVKFHTITHNIDKWSNYKDEPNIADIAVWSLFKQYPLNKKPQVLNELYDICEKKFS